MPVRGLCQLCPPARAGDDFVVLESEKEVKTLSETRAQESKVNKNPLSFVTQESAFSDKFSATFFDNDVSCSKDLTIISYFFSSGKYLA